MKEGKAFKAANESNGVRHVILPVRKEPQIEDLKRMLNAILDLLSRGYGNTIIDLRDVQVLSPACAGYLSLMTQRLDAAGGKLKVRVRSGKVRQILEMSGLSDGVEMEPLTVSH